MSLAKLFFMKETFRAQVRHWRQACFRQRSHARREQRFMLEALEPRVLLSATSVNPELIAPDASSAPMQSVVQEPEVTSADQPAANLDLSVSLIQLDAAPVVTTSWTNSNGGNWSDPNNWSTQLAPTATDNVGITLDGIYTVTLDVNNVNIASLTLGGATGTQTFSLTGRTLTLADTSIVNATGLVNLSSSTVNGAGTLTNTGTMILHNSILADSFVNAGTVIARGNSALTGPVTTGAGSTLRVQGDNSVGQSTLTVAQGFTNEGLLELVSQDSSHSETLIVSSGTLVNAVGGTIASRVGAGGPRTLTAQLDNKGTLLVEQDLTITNSGRTFTATTGTVNVVDGKTLTISAGTTVLGAPSFTGLGLINWAGSATIQVPTSGTLTGQVGFSGTVTVEGPGTFINQTTLELTSDTVSAAFVNAGTVIARGNSALTGPVTTGAGSTLRVQGDNGVGSSTLTVAQGFTNEGLLELVSQDSSYSETLIVSSGTLVNAVGGTIASRAGTGGGGGRTLTAQLDNAGTLLVEQDLTITNSGRTFTATTGTVNVVDGKTLTISAGTTVLGAPSFTGLGLINWAGSATIQVPTSGTLTGQVGFSGTVTVEGPGTFINQTTLELTSDTVSAAFVNAGTVIARGNSALTGPVTTGAGSTLRVQGDNGVGSSTLTVAQGFTNEGLLELVSQDSSYSETLIVSSGTLVNAVGGTIASRAGTGGGGGRTLTAQLDNKGTLLVEQALSLNQNSADHVNSGTISLTGGDLTVSQSGTTPSFSTTGTIAIGAARTLAVNNGTLAYGGGTLAGLGTVALTNTTVLLTADFTPETTLTLRSTTLTGPGTFTNAAGRTLDFYASTIASPFVNAGTVIARGNSALTGPVTTGAGSTLRVQGDNGVGSSTLTVAQGFTNEGLLELVSQDSSYSETLIVSSGTLVNAVGGTIASRAGTGGGGGRTLTAQLDNKGTLLVEQALSLNQNSADHVNSGTISLTGGDLTVSQSGTTPSFSTTGTIAIGAARTLAVNNGTLAYGGGTLAGLGTVALTNTTVLLTADFTPETTLTLRSTTLTGPGTFTNAAGRTLDFYASTIASPFVNAGTVIARGNSALTGPVTTGAGSTLRVQGDNGVGSSTLTVAQGFTNEGLLELVSQDSSYSETLIVSSGTLVNAVGGTIASRAGTGGGGGRTLTAQLDNKGTLLVEQALSLNQNSADHVNSGTISLTGGDLTVSQSGTTPSFSTTGTIAIGAARTLAVNNGTLAYGGGTLAGLGTVALTNTTVLLTADFTPETTLTLRSTTLTGPGTFTNAAGRTLDFYASTIASPFVNAGTVIARGNSALTGPVTTGAGSTLRVQGDNGVGSSTLTVAQGFTNEGLLELVSQDSSYSETLIVSSGTLVNAVGGTIASRAGTGGGGGRTLTAQLDNKGTLLVEQALSLNQNSADHVNSGTISLTGGDLTVSQSGTTPSFSTTGTIAIGAARTLAVNNGTLTNFSGGVLTGGIYNLAGTFRFDNASIVSLAATVILDGAGAGIVNQSLTNALTNLSSIAQGGNLTLAGDRDFSVSGAFSNAGTLDLSVGSLFTVPGNYTQASTGTVHVAIAGLVAGTDTGRLVVSGQAALDGALNVSLAGGFLPAEGNTFSVATYGSRAGAFATIGGLDLGNGLLLEPSYTATALTLLTKSAPLNRPPVALNDAITTEEDTPFTVNVLANDSDPDGDPLVIAGFTTSTHGQITLGIGGSFTYTPTANFHGGDSFSYTVRDGRGGEATATVAITITAVSDPPLAVNDTASTPEETPVRISVLANDTDPDGGTLSLLVVLTQPTHGTAVDNGDGTVTYTPSANFNGTDSFVYRAQSSSGITPATVTITVTPVNDPPIGEDDTATAFTGTPLSIPVLTNDSDVDGDILTIQSLDTTGIVGTVEIDPGATTLTYTSAVAFLGTESFTYTVSDGHGGTGTATVTVTVEPLNIADLIIEDGSAPDTAQFGALIPVSWTVRNIGTAAATNTWTDKVWLSPDNVLLDGNDLLLFTDTGGPLAADGSYTRNANVTVPFSAGLVDGTYYLFVQTDTGNSQLEADELNNLSVTTITLTTPPLPDLIVSAITAPTEGLAGQPIQVNWTLTNQGTEAATGSWTDSVYLSGDAVTGGDQLLGSFLFTGTIAAGESLVRTQFVSLPTDQLGDQWIVVQTDVLNQVAETSGENNATIDDQSVTVKISDLVVENPTAPATAQFGQTIQVQWTVRNDGDGAATQTWSDKVWLSTDGVLDGNDLLLLTQSGSPLAAGASYTRNANVTLPLNTTLAVGTYHVLFQTDAQNVQLEQNESNNLVDVALDLSFPPLAELAVTDIVAPVTGLAGRTIQVSWTVTNSGSLAATGNWSDQVYLSGDAVAGGDTLLGSFYYSGNSLSPGGSVTRTAQVTLPQFVTGNQRVVVRTDIGNAVFELNEINNTAVDDAPVSIGAALTLTIVPAGVNETSGANAATATVSRSGDTASQLEVILNQSGSDLVLPNSVFIPAGQSSVNVAVGMLDNSFVDGNRTSVITASATGFADGSDSLNIVDNDMPILSLSAAVLSIDEAYGPLNVTVTRNTDPSGELTVTLLTDKSYKLTVPASVVIPDGATSTTFQVTPVNDTIVEGNRNVDITASTAGFATGVLQLEVVENDIPALSLDLATSVISEGAGAAATYGTVTRSIVTDTPVVVALFADVGRVRLPNSVLIAAGEASASFNITVQDNEVSDGNHSVSLFADVVDAFSFVSLPGTRVEATLLVTDDDGPTITLMLDKNVVAESAGVGAATGTVIRNTPATEDLTVLLSSSDNSEAALPFSVVIPAGQQSVNFAVNAIQDGIQDGTQNVTLTASASGFNDGTVSLQVTDRELADLQVSSITLPATATTGSTIDLQWMVENAGFGAASGSWADNVFLSTDNLLSGDDQMLGSFSWSTALAEGEAYTRSLSMTLGEQVGTVWVFVATDVGANVVEISDSNNTRALSMVINPSYRAEVSTDVEQSATGTAIPLIGRAFDPATNAPKVFVLVSIDVETRGMVRTITAVTDSLGNFSTEFIPLPGEAGHYTVSADHPDVFDRTPQDAFDLLGMKAAGGINVNLVPGQAKTGQIELKNLGLIDLTNVVATVGDLPAGISVTFDAPALLPGSGTAMLSYTITAAAEAQALIGTTLIQISSAEGVTITTTLALSVTPLTPQLVANPGFLIGGMLRGEQRVVSFEITNTGGAPTGELAVQLPQTTWLKLGSSAQLPSLAPGERTVITLILSPEVDLPLQRYDGTLNIVGENSYVTVPFQFRAVSEAVGDVQVRVVDEYTYFAADKPNVANATVQLLDPFTFDVIATAVTGPTGIVTFTDIPEGQYTLNVSATQHSSARTTVQVTPGGQVEEEVFLPRQVVTYNWTVVPTEIQDRYKVVLESTFETEVPMPVVTVDEPYIIPLVVPGLETQFNITLRNHGLIEATEVKLIVPQDPDYIITPLISEIPVLAAKSAITIPVTIRIRPDSSLLNQTAVIGSQLSTSGAVGDAANLSSCLELGTIYRMECRGGIWRAAHAGSIQPALGKAGCIESVGEATGEIIENIGGVIRGSMGNIITAAAGTVAALTSCEFFGDNSCVQAALTTLASAASGAVQGSVVPGVGTFAGAIGGVISNWSDIMGCFCSLGGSSGPNTELTGSGNSPTGSGNGSPNSPYSSGSGSGWGYNIICDPTAFSGVGLISAGDGVIITQADNAICATVRLQIEQEAVITRTAFLGTLELTNGRSDTTLEDVSLMLDIRDAAGNAANDLFVLRGPTLESVLVDGEGHWSIGPDTSGLIQYTIVPTLEAAPDQPTFYSIGGMLHYIDNGTAIDVPLFPDRITVYPEAQLTLDYFWQRDVIGDDPFTDAIEASEPIAVGLQVVNVGKGAAGDLTITSAQPQIIENEKGLLIDFTILSSQVGAEVGTPSLTVDLGSIAPGETQTAQWNMISSLQGKFKDFTATFEHLDDGGELRTSLIQSVTIHELIRAVQVTTPTDDQIPDYLVNDLPDPDNLSDVLYLSTGGQAPVSVATDAVLSGGLTQTLTATMEGGWSYLKVADALPGYELTSVVRSDGKAMPLDGMVWRTNRTFHAGEPGATNENLIHLLDHNSTGSYTLTFAIVDHVAPTIESVGGVTAGLHTTPVGAVEITFSEAIDPATLSAADLTLEFNGAPVSLAGVTFLALNETTWQIAGLSGATAGDGNYRLVVDAHGITDLAGNSGTNSAAVEWAMGATAPVIVDVDAITPNLRNSPVLTVDVQFSRAMNPASLDWTDLSLTRDGSGMALNSSITVTPLSPTTFRINGLGAFTGAEGTYVLTVQAGNTQDTNGVAGVGQVARTWQMDSTGPTLTGIQNVTTDPRNIVVLALTVDFSEAIDPASFDWHDLTLTRNAGSNLITNEVTVEQVDADTWRIKEFNWVVGLDGQYVLTVLGAGITDLAGNAGTGAVSETWTMDIGKPGTPTNLVISPDHGLSDTDRRTNTLNLTLTGDVAEPSLTVRLTDVTANKELGYATVTGSSFSGQFTLSGPGQHNIRVRAVDDAGNTADEFIEVFIDTTAPGVASLAGIAQNPRTTPVDTVDVTLDEAIDLAGFTVADVSLTRDGLTVALDSSVTIAHVVGTTYRVSGLTAFTDTLGVYQLTVSATGLVDLAGNPGIGAKTASWTTLTVLPTGIRGVVYDDLDGSGTFNPASFNPESAIAGRTVFLDANANDVLDAGESSTISGTDGTYAFNDLLADSYRVSQVLPAGWILTAPSGGTHTVNLVEGQTVTGINFANFHTGTIDGVKFHDLNADGTREAGEAALAGWTIFLDANANGSLDSGEVSVVTGADGVFSFTNLGPGTVQISEVVQTGWQRTTPAVPYRIKSGFSVTADLGNVELGSLSGVKFNDLNGDGVRDAGEPGIEGWTIFLDANTNGLLDLGEASTLTDAAGTFSFLNLLPGSYTVVEEQRAGWIQTKPLPSAVSVGLTTAGSDIALESLACSCGGTWATGTTVVGIDYGQLAIQTALETVGIRDLRQQPGYADLDGRGVTTVVIDTGMDLDHEFFGADVDGNGIADRILYQWDFADGDPDASDVNGHGSHIASLIGSQDDLYMGVAPGTDLIVLKVFEDAGRGTFSYLEQALQWVVAYHDQYNVGVVNLSLGDSGNWTDEFSRYGIGDELAALAQTDVIVIAAAGNNYLQFGRMGVAYPASDPAAIAVGATWAADFGGPWTVSTGATNYVTGEDQVAAFSQRDTSRLDTFAPGARFNGADANGGIRTMQGTSQAAAFVSGTAALAQQIAQETLGRGLTTAEFATLLRATGDQIMDGDNEIDNVTNTGLTFSRLNMQALAEGILALGATPPDATGGTGTTGGTTGIPQPATAGAPGVHTVTLAAGAVAAGLDFGNFQLGAMQGIVFEDGNGDGLRQAAEAGLAGWTVYLDANDNQVLDGTEQQTLSDTGGAYAFTDVGPGTYHVRVALPTDWTITAPAGGAHLVALTSGLLADARDFGVHLAPAVNTAPVLNTIGDQSVDEETELRFTVSGSDGDVPSQPLTYSATGLPSGATFDPTTREFVWTPTEAQGPGSYTVTFSVSDGVVTTSEVVAITVNEVNVAPVLNAIGNKSVDELTELRFTLSGSDVDDPTQTLTYSATGLPTGAIFNATTREFVWTPTEAQGPNSYPVTFSVTDGVVTTSELVTITVGEVNGAPGLNAIGNQSVDEETELRFTLSGSDVDDPTQTLTYSATGLPTGAIFNATTREFVWTPTEAQGPNSYPVTFSVTDGVVTTSEVVTITVREVNGAPGLAPIGAKTVNAGTQLTFTATATDPDLPTQALSYSLAGGAPAGAAIDPSTGVFTWTPTVAQASTTYNLTVTVTDGVVTVGQPFSVTVTSGNQAPVLAPIGPKTVAEGTVLTFTISATDVNVPVQTLTYSAIGLPTGATFNATTRQFSWTPTEAQGPGSFIVTFRVSDGIITTSEAVTISVTEVNQAPTLAAITDQTTRMGRAVTVRAVGSDADRPRQTLTYSLAAGAPTGATINPTTGVFSWTPTESAGNSPGQFALMMLVSDGHLTAARAFTVTVNQNNTIAPYIINGTNGNDIITITELPNNVVNVTMNGTTTTVTLAARRELQVYALDGNDVVNLVGLTRPTYVDGGNGHDLIQGRLVTSTAATLWFQGGEGFDRLEGGAADDHLDGGLGNDFLSGGSGDDLLYGREGMDILLGDAGNDQLEGGGGDDFLWGGFGNDTLLGHIGQDILVGGAGSDTIEGGGGNDTIDAGAGNDTVRGGEGDDILLGGTGNDNLRGAAGDDRIAGQGGRDTINGGLGIDQAVPPAAGSGAMVSIETVLTVDTVLRAGATAAKQAWVTQFVSGLPIDGPIDDDEVINIVLTQAV